MVLTKLEKKDINLKEIIEDILFEEGGELFRFNSIVFRINGRTEGKYPHLHFRRSNGKEGAIRLDIAEYYLHGNPLKYTETLSKSELKLFVKNISINYKRDCSLWNYIPDGLKINIDNNPPNYNNIVYPR